MSDKPLKKKDAPIGFFDSGIGGSSIWKEVVSLLPNENTLYLSDSKNAPYGEKSKQEIIDLSIKNTEILIAKECKIIVAACNTATTNAIEFLRKKYAVSFIGIEPAIKPAALKTNSNSIGILATKGTLNSELFEKTSNAITHQTTIKEIIGTGLVELIEQGKLDSQEMTDLLSFYLKPIQKSDIDCLVLGCTHYPYLIPKIKAILGDDIQVIDSGEAVAEQTKNILKKENLLNENTSKSTHQFYINDEKKVLKNILKNVNIAIKITQKEF